MVNQSTAMPTMMAMILTQMHALMKTALRIFLSLQLNYSDYQFFLLHKTDIVNLIVVASCR